MNAKQEHRQDLDRRMDEQGQEVSRQTVKSKETLASVDEVLREFQRLERIAKRGRH